MIDLARTLNEKLINEIQVLNVFKLKIRNKKSDVSHILGNTESLSKSVNSSGIRHFLPPDNIEHIQHVHLVLPLTNFRSLVPFCNPVKTSNFGQKLVEHAPLRNFFKNRISIFCGYVQFMQYVNRLPIYRRLNSVGFENLIKKIRELNIQSFLILAYKSELPSTHTFIVPLVMSLRVMCH